MYVIVLYCYYTGSIGHIMTTYSTNRVIEIENECTSRDFDLETAYVVHIYWFKLPDDHRTHIRNNILPQCVIINHGFLFVCDEGTATCIELAYKDYIIKTVKYSKWRKRQLYGLHRL